jgi:hypothetical protein
MCFSMAGMGNGKKSTLSAWLEYLLLEIVRFSMTGLCHGFKCYCQHVWNLSWLKLPVLACLRYDNVKNDILSIAGMCHGHITIVSFSMCFNLTGIYHGQKSCPW